MPSSPDTGSEDISSLITGLSQAASSKRASLCALTRVWRDRPEPLSITSSSAGRPRPPLRSVSQRSTRARAASGVAGSPGAASRARVSMSCCAITLLLYLLMSRTASASAGERSSNAGLSSAGARPARTVPLSWPPISRHRASIKRAS